MYSKIQQDKTKSLLEAYSGGGSVGLALFEANVIDHLILNDIDYGIYALYFISVNEPNKIIDLINTTIPSYEDFYNAQRIVIGQYNNCDLLAAAWSCLVVNRLSYSGICKAGPLGGKKVNLSLATLLDTLNIGIPGADIILTYDRNEYI